MTNYDEFIGDATFPDRDVVDINLDETVPGDFDGHDCQHAVIDLHYHGQHLVMVPFTAPTEFTVELAMFDKSGTRTAHRLLSVMDADAPFALGGDAACDP